MQEELQHLEQLLLGALAKLKVLQQNRQNVPQTQETALDLPTPTSTPSVAPTAKLSLVDAMIQVESGGDDNAIGDHGNAFGCLQMWQGVVDAVNAVLGTHHVAKDTLGNRQLSLLIFNTYFEKCYPNFTTDEEKAFCWNGGPGWQEYYGVPEHEVYTQRLDTYWMRVQKAMV